MPRTIYMPKDPWSQMLPQLVGQMAMAKYAQSLKDPKFTEVGPDPDDPEGPNRIARYDRKQQKLVLSKLNAPRKDSDKGPTFTKIEGDAFQKWVDEKPLTDREQKIVDKRFAKSGTRQSPADILKNTKARQQAWAEGFETYVGRPPDKLEARKYFLNDMYGILEPEELPEGLTEKDVNYNMKKYKKSRIEIIDQYIKSQGK